MTMRLFSSMPTATARSTKITLKSIQKLYAEKIPICAMTAYDYPSANLVQKAGMDICLVGDSLAMTALGYASTNEISFTEMLHHSRAVHRACKSAFLIGDLPFSTYETSPEQALDNSIKYLQSGGVEAVKLEGGKEMFGQVEKIARAGIPVMGHIGLTPQRSASLGGYRVQGKTTEKAQRLLEDALALQEAGAFSIVLEAMPSMVARFITQELSIPTIGIGAGPGCNGQVLVFTDALGLADRVPKFCQVYAKLGDVALAGLNDYKNHVRDGSFPDNEHHCYDMVNAEEEALFEAWKAAIHTRSDV